MGLKDISAVSTLPGMPGPWGIAIRRLIAERQTTQRALAKRAGLSENTLSKIVNGRHTLTSQLQAIADVFGVPIETVLQSDRQDSGYGFATPIPESGGSRHEQGVTVQPPTPEVRDIRELQAQVGLLQHQLAEIVATKEAKRRRRRKRVRHPRAGKPRGVKDAGKPR